jgi:uncharacterized protein (DUF1810 family)
MSDNFNLQRFVEAQESDIDSVERELSAGKKSRCWMWYIFPQFLGLGRSMTSRMYAISSLKEAEAFLAHPILGARLRECTRIVLNLEGRSAEQIFSYPDYLKFHSCMTLFSKAAPSPNVYEEALMKYFGGITDQATLALINKS